MTGGQNLTLRSLESLGKVQTFACDPKGLSRREVIKDVKVL